MGDLGQGPDTTSRARAPGDGPGPAAPPAGTGPAHDHGPAGPLADLFSYPLMSALTERRTRRVPRGRSVAAGPLSHESTNAPAPLTPLEEALLVTCVTGITGVATHDAPLVRPDGTPGLGTPFLNVMARAASSADNAQATHFFMVTDDGVFLLRHPTGTQALEMLDAMPRSWAQWNEADWLEVAERCKVRVSDRRIEFPRESPYYQGWNAEVSNVPGTTLFLPVVDCTWQYVNALLLLAAEPDGARAMLVDDWRAFHPRGAGEWLARARGALRLGPRIPHQPVGGLSHVRSGFVSRDHVVPLGVASTMGADHEASFHLQNLMLVGQAMGLGGWLHRAVPTPYLWQTDPARGWFGLGFRMEQPGELSPPAPAPAGRPNPVGIDGILEGLCPPYVSSTAEAVDRVLEAKYGAAGPAYGNDAVFSRSFRDAQDARAHLDHSARPTPQQVQYVKDACAYVDDTYGRFPAHVDAFTTPGTWLQFSHLELEYYDRFLDPGQLTRQAAHDGLWHR